MTTALLRVLAYEIVPGDRILDEEPYRNEDGEMCYDETNVSPVAAIADRRPLAPVARRSPRVLMFHTGASVEYPFPALAVEWILRDEDPIADEDDDDVAAERWAGLL